MVSFVFVGRVFDRARPERRTGAGVCIHAPGGLGVFIIVILPVMTGVDCSDPSDGKSGRSGISGISMGSEGILSITFEVLKVSRGGVTMERAGSLTMIGGEPASGEPFLGEFLGGDPPLTSDSEASRNGDNSFKPEKRGEGCSGNTPGRGVLLTGVSVGDSSSLPRWACRQ